MNKPHRPCFMLALILGAGVAAGESIPVFGWVGLPAAGLVVLAYVIRQHTVLLYVAIFLLGAFWMQQQHKLPPESIAFLSNVERKNVRAIEGVVDEAPRTLGGRQVFELEVRRILYRPSGDALIPMEIRWEPSRGKVQVNVYAGRTPAYGDLCRIQGSLRPFLDFGRKNGFSYRHYMRKRGVYWMMRLTKEGQYTVLSRGQGNVTVAWALGIRQHIVAVFNRYLAPVEASFVAALVLGEHNAMPKELKQVFINTGTAHILAISGMNMAVIAAVFFFILRFAGLPRAAQFLGTIVFLFMYAFISGWSPSVVRACLMSAVILASFAFEHEGEGLNSLGLAAIILLVSNPANLFSIGFQLSFAAVAAILVLMDPCKKLFRMLPDVIGTSMAVSLAAWAGTAPIIFYHFKMITPISILANIPVVPLADSIMVLGLGLAATGGWCAYLGHAFAGLLKAALSAMVTCAAWFDQVPYGHFLVQ